MRKIVSIILAMLVFSTVASAVPSTIVLNPSEKTVNIGDGFTVVLYVTVVGEVDTVAVDRITWNTNVLNCTGIVQGDLFPTTLIWLQGKITGEGLKDSVMASNIPISNKSGTYAILSFKVTGSGDTTITVHGFGVARAGLPLNTSISGGCHVIINSSSNYQPAISNGNLNGSWLPYYVLIAAIVLVAVAIGVLIKKRKKVKEEDDTFKV